MSFRVNLPLERAQRVRHRRRRRADGLHHEALPRLAALRRRRLAAPAVAAGQEGAGVLLDSRRLGRRPRRRDGGLPAQHDGRRVLSGPTRRWAAGTWARCAPPRRWPATWATREFAATCRDLFERGSRWIDAHLFNGEYYEHQIRPRRRPDYRRRAARCAWARRTCSDPDFQLGPGCLVDQLVGPVHGARLRPGLPARPASTCARRWQSILQIQLGRDTFTGISTTCAPSP